MKENSKAVREHKKLFATNYELFDVSAKDHVTRQSLQIELRVSMSDMEYKYYANYLTNTGTATRISSTSCKGMYPLFCLPTMIAGLGASQGQ